MTESQDHPPKVRFTRRLLDAASTPRISILDVALLALSTGLAVALVVTVTKPITRTPRLATTSVLGHRMIWTTLGTTSGPIASAGRSQPANLLWDNQHAILVDAGDGAAEQIAKAGHALTDVDTVILSHLHIDHTGGLSAIIGMRYQQHIPGTLTIYGPPGTRELVDGILASGQPLLDLDAASNPQVAQLAPSKTVVVEITDGEKFAVDGVRITAVENSHYGFKPGTANFKAYQSLSYRFDMSDRSIVFTGDTGPSDAVQTLAKGVDLLVCEITDPDADLAALKAERPDLPVFAYPVLKNHFEQQHLTADAVGRLASGAGVGSVVTTHDPMPDSLIPQARARIAARYEGPVAFAKDLDNF
jgi:ribonuclease BN (tRNA processing enzyme)